MDGWIALLCCGKGIDGMYTIRCIASDKDGIP
jgi:hypothetical protein